MMHGSNDVPGLFFQITTTVLPLTVPRVATICSWLNHIAILTQDCISFPHYR